MDNHPNNNSVQNQEPNQTFSPQQPTAPTSNPVASMPPTEPGETPPVAKPIAVGAEKSHKSKSGVLVLILVIVMATVGGYLLYKHSTKKAAPVAKTVTKQDIPLLRIGVGDGPVNSFYPAGPNTSGVTFTDNQIFEALVGWQNGTKVVPMLATSWTNPDDSTWIFTIRSNVQFHTGNALTANDVKYSLDKFKDTAYGGGAGLGDTIKSVEVVSPTKVKITTDGPDPILLNRLASLFIVDSKGTKQNDAINGTGPYIVKPATDPSKDTVTDLVPFTGYWGGHVYTKELKISAVTDANGAITQLQKHQIDVFEQFTSLSEVKTLKDDNINTVAEESSTVDMLVLNTVKTGSPLASLPFRQALNIGISRSAILKAADLQGTSLGQFVVKEIPGYDASIAVPTQDVAKAKQLIASSGVKTPTLTLSYTTDASNDKAVKEIQTELAAIGVTLKLDPQADVGVLADSFFAGKLDMLFLGYSADLFDASDPFTTLFQNPSTFDNQAVDDLLTKANQTLDGAKHITLLQQAAQKLNDNVPAIPLFSRTGFYAQTSTSYTLHRDIPGAGLGVYLWKVYQQ
ncbi:MAG TPA: ABC transporter substrate-binding protein [Patescibacteria group bacterium]|nr:ABC transporter substrate-binding protein [Patescibacteria group bacterium]